MIMAICAHFIDQYGVWQTKLLALRNVEGKYSGENMAAIVLKVIKEYGISCQIRYFMLDNVTANDTYVNYILCTLYLNLSKK